MYHFRDQILAGNPELFFVMNADVCCDFPLKEMLEFHRSKNSDIVGTMLTTEVLFVPSINFRPVSFIAVSII